MKKQILFNSKKYFYIENFGCQMNVSDSEIITSILLRNGFNLSKSLKEANIILLNSCSIREKAEITLKNRLKELKNLKDKYTLFGIIGCITKQKIKYFLNKQKVDFFANPDSYKEIPKIIYSCIRGEKIIYTPKKKETYSDIIPFHFSKKIKSFLSITRGCDNMCTFCIVPFTRGREVSRDPNSIIKEAQYLFEKGYKEITLLGQNVDSYKWESKSNIDKYYKKHNKKYTINFSELLELIAKKIPFIRIRFSTSNPHDMSDEVLKIISKYKNICKHIHLPVQSGSNKILKLMNRKYTREKYLSLIKRIKTIVPECSISHDIMTGFCEENEKDHLDTLSLMNEVKYNYGYMFSYSPRPGTYAYRNLPNNVPNEIKKKRLIEIIELQKLHSIMRMKEYLGKEQEILIEGISKKSYNYLYGRNSQNIVVVFPKGFYKIGDIVKVKIQKITSATLIGNLC
ncbi:tRNA (N6-isopentenyl adenosine(37)-C2)-methylthiotransferase MiaB [Blattabacterium cuenoti]|uniref:tRNA (N6-isopentenyl adenosine(37)-C2)-methylthiotransferase MiaB n=1 Tax=Blattabacterium cuenoti TaxID=1653831 RepID=UPI00163B9AF0|nr:tRNA (N6-isopentenyl adenosine(37)-C2)-methylthiotransferase MiaB [Blattabacterium cuenoti]